MKRLMVVLLSMFLLVACKTPVVGMQQHPSFTYETVMQNQIAIGGVVSTVDQLTDVERIRFSDILFRELVDEREGIQIIRAGLVVKAMGLEQHQQWLDDYMLTGTIAYSDTSFLREKFPHARYLVLSRIELHDVSSSHSETETDVADSKEDREKGEYEFVRVDVSLKTKRQMGVSLAVYDLQQKLMVWSGYISNTDTNSNDASRTFDKHNRWREELADAFIDALIDEKRNNYPAPPPLEHVLAGVFSGFAENMPEPGKK